MAESTNNLGTPAIAGNVDPAFAAHNEAMRIADIEKRIREGALPTVAPYNIAKGPLVQWPTLLARFPVFRYTTAGLPNSFTPPNFLVCEEEWGSLYYSGPVLSAWDQTVLLATLKCGVQYMAKGPRKLFRHLRVAIDNTRLQATESGRPLDLLPDGGIDDDYLDAAILYGSTTLSDVVRTMGIKDTSGSFLRNVRVSLMNMWDARFYLELREKQHHPRLPDWLTLDEQALEQRLDADVTSDPGASESKAPIDPKLGALARLAPHDGFTSPITQHPFFKIVWPSGMKAKARFHVVVPPLFTQLLLDRHTWLDLRVRDELSRQPFANQLWAYICTQTSRKSPQFQRYAESLIDPIGFNNRVTWNTKGEGEKEGPNLAKLRKLLSDAGDLYKSLGLVSYFRLEIAKHGSKNPRLDLCRLFDGPAADTRD